jgi:hypothetical protein
MTTQGKIRIAKLLLLLTLAVSASVAGAQTAIPYLPNPSNGNGVTLQQLAMLRYLQGRSGGGVKRGVPQFIPFGGGGMPFDNQMNQGGGMPMQGQGGGAVAATDPDAKPGKKSVAEKKAEAEAAREAKKQKARERAEKRKADLAARRGKAAGGK